MKFIFDIGQTFFFLFLFVSCAQRHTPHEQEAKELSLIFHLYWEDHAKLFPLEATLQGDHRYNHILRNDQTEEFRDELRALYQNYLERVSQYDRRKLTPEAQLSYDIFLYEMRTSLEGLRSNLWMIPFHQFSGLPLTMGQLGAGTYFQPFENEQDYRNWLGRIDGFVQWTDSAIRNFRHGIKQGVVLPAVLVERMIPQMQKIVVKDPSKSIFFGPVRNFPAHISKPTREQLRSDYVKAIQTKISPSYQKLASFLKDEYLPAARISDGLAALPKGNEEYLYLVKYWTTTGKNPEEIYQLGLSEVKRIQAEMLKVKQAVGFKGSLKEFFEHMRTHPKFMPYRKPEEVLTAFREIQTRMQPKLLEMFGREPKTPFEIRQTEEFRAASASAEYSPGSPDGSRPGIFYLPITDARTFNITSGMESLFLHEAIPGHHYQISLQQENQELPSFRRFAWYGAFGEGWALYTESLGKELGLYTDPYQYMGALGDEIHRAIRLVVDVAIHTKGMKRQEAINYLMENEPVSLEYATSEVERYMAMPAQALSYKIGSIFIWDIRRKYEKQLGVKFSLSNFHDELLKDGVMPLEVMQNKMDAWARSR
jgi:uncharacterized protein (DUF885 family)